MSKTANADNADFVGGLYIKLDDWVENRNATAKKRSGFARVKPVWQSESPAPMATYAIGKGSRASDDCPLRLLAQVVIPAQTLWASHVALGKPPQPDFVAGFQVIHLAADSNNMSYGFVSRNKRIGSHLPLIVAH